MCIDNVNSNPTIIRYGVPQLSLLEPLLFLILVNDILKCAKQIQYILNADDSTLSTIVYVPDGNVKGSAEL